MENPEAEVEVWAMDEHRVGLQPTTQRGWSPKGKRAIRAVRPGYKWVHVWTWVHPATGRFQTWLTNKQDIELHNELLVQVAEAMGVGPNRRVLVVLDGASWHTSAKVRVPQYMELFFLPPFTPELQPTERFWPLLDEPLVGLPAKNIEEVEEVLAQRLGYLDHHPEQVRGRTLFWWWPEQPSTFPN
ncbi:MAG: IS630 family transposase [Flavobacterium sp.]